MVARMAWIPSHGTYSVNTNDPYNPDSGVVTFIQAEPREISSNEGSPVAPQSESQQLVKEYLTIASLANLAKVTKTEGAWQAHGDPTEIALKVFATRFNRSEDAEEAEWKELAEFPFDSSIKLMSMLCAHIPTGRVSIFTKGAVERVLANCSTILSLGNPPAPLTATHHAQIHANMESLARRGLRVLALASRHDFPPISPESSRRSELNRADFEHSLTFCGLIGIYDPPRPESRPSVFKALRAGISVHMLTGDHPFTAKAIASEVGILPSRMELIRSDIAQGMIMTAAEFDRLTDEEIDALPELPLVVARCTPNTKVRMIDALHRRGKYVAMTGDGVNDSPSLKRADVGIAMGLNGSDVAKSAADIVLSDDNFASILNAIEEGRRIFDNVQKFMLHVLSANVGFVTTLMVGLAYKDKSGTSVYQVTPIEILWMLLVAGAFTETGLGFEAASKHILSRPPQSVGPPPCYMMSHADCF